MEDELSRGMMEPIYEPTLEAFSVNGYPQKKVNGEWVPDEEARRSQLDREAREQKHKDELVFACRSRLLTADEMAEVESEGIHLFLRYSSGMSQQYKEEELERRLNDLLLQQFRLRLVIERGGNDQS